MGRVLISLTYLQNKQFFKRLLQFGYISDRILVGDLLDDADHGLSFTSFIESFVTTGTYFD